MEMQDKKKILITGCGGMLGRAIYDVFKDHFELMATDIDLNEPWLKYLDVRDYSSVEKVLNEFKPDIILHLAALTDLEFQEKNPEEAYRTNTIGTENMVLLARKNGILLVYISTAGIFDGEKDLYNDYDVPNPLSHYGKSKYMGELCVKGNLDKYFVFRAGWMMGGGKKDKKFIYKILKQIKEGKKEIYAIENIYGTPTCTYDLARTIFEVIKTEYYGVYNCVCKGGRVSRYDVALEIINLLGLSDEIKIHKVFSDFFSASFFAPRPRSEAMIDLKLELRNMNKMRDWKECLKEYISNIKATG